MHIVCFVISLSVMKCDRISIRFSELVKNIFNYNENEIKGGENELTIKMNK